MYVLRTDKCWLVGAFCNPVGAWHRTSLDSTNNSALGGDVFVIALARNGSVTAYMAHNTTVTSTTDTSTTPSPTPTPTVTATLSTAGSGGALVVRTDEIVSRTIVTDDVWHHVGWRRTRAGTVELIVDGTRLKHASPMRYRVCVCVCVCVFTSCESLRGNSLVIYHHRATHVPCVTPVCPTHRQCGG